MDGLTSGERLLLFAILGLFAAAGLVQMGARKGPKPDAPPSEVELIALEQIAARTDEADPVQAERTALNIASNRLAKAEDRVKAIELCARLGAASALPVVRGIMTSEEDDIRIRASAIAAIAVLGDQTDEPTLRLLASSEDEGLRAAATDALARMKKQG
jgi:hypothetical protein